MALPHVRQVALYKEAVRMVSNEPSPQQEEDWAIHNDHADYHKEIWYDDPEPFGDMPVDVGGDYCECGQHYDAHDPEMHNIRMDAKAAREAGEDDDPSLEYWASYPIDRETYG
jgi:hypothetical protein